MGVNTQPEKLSFFVKKRANIRTVIGANSSLLTAILDLTTIPRKRLIYLFYMTV